MAGPFRIDAVIDISDSDEQNQLHGQDTTFHKGNESSLTTASAKGLDFNDAEG